jgi:hypothetical protein
VTELDTGPRIDSRPGNLLHSLRVGALMVPMIQELAARSVNHDLSKTRPPEVDAFDRAPRQLSEMRYGSDEYNQSLALLGPALEHHYAVERHHPQHFPNGVNGMTLVDLIEMLADWKAAGERMADGGDLARSIRVGTDRFGLTEQLAEILVNTAVHFGMMPTPTLAE